MSTQAAVDELQTHEAAIASVYQELRELIAGDINNLPAPTFRAYVNARKAVMRAEIEVRVLREQLAAATGEQA